MEEKNIIGQVIPLKNLVDYQKNSVVSRQVIAQKTGTVTIFAFDHGEGLS